MNLFPFILEYVIVQNISSEAVNWLSKTWYIDRVLWEEMHSIGTMTLVIIGSYTEDVLEQNKYNNQTCN